MSGLYEILGVSPDADEETIRRAHKARAKKTHPDQGGNPEDFQRVQGAWLVLRDPARRAHYDRTGETEAATVDHTRQAALSLIAQSVGEALQAENAAHADFAKLARDRLKHESAQLAAAKEHRKRRDAIERNARRWRRKPGAEGPDVVAAITQSQIVAAESMVAQCEREIETRAAAVEILDGYEYEFTEPPPAPTQFMGSYNITGSSSTWR